MMGSGLAVSELEEFYYFLPLGQSIGSYIAHAVPLLLSTFRQIRNGIKRSLPTAIITASHRMEKKLAKVVNAVDKGRILTVDVTALDADNVKKIDVPYTSPMLRELWQSYDLTKQEYLLLLGINYNPEKRERLLQDELNAHSQEIEVIRDFLLECAKISFAKYGMDVRHTADVVEARAASRPGALVSTDPVNV
jgi:hypothetical protein